MVGIPQLGIALGALGIVLAFMGLFPGVTGFSPAAGVGLLQFVVILTGYSLLTFGAMIYVKYAIYPDRPSNLAQQIGIRLALTGLVLAFMVGMADFLDFGSHPRTVTSDAYFGQLQALGTLLGLALASLGVLLYSIAGSPRR
jgi:hypothetical protein